MIKQARSTLNTAHAAPPKNFLDIQFSRNIFHDYLRTLKTIKCPETILMIC